MGADRMAGFVQPLGGSSQELCLHCAIFPHAIRRATEHRAIVCTLCHCLYIVPLFVHCAIVRTLCHCLYIAQCRTCSESCCFRALNAILCATGSLSAFLTTSCARSRVQKK